jgi:hypothetical protein
MSDNPAVEAISRQLEQLVSVAELSKIEGFSKNHIYDGVKHRGWPHYKRGREIKFSLEQILEIREMDRREARPPRRPSRAPRRKSRAAA